MVLYGTTLLLLWQKDMQGYYLLQAYIYLLLYLFPHGWALRVNKRESNMPGSSLSRATRLLGLKYDQMMI